MLVKFFKRGNGNTRNGSSVQNYLLNEERLANQTAQLLRGDPDLTTAIIDTLDFATTYTAGCLSFTAEEKIDELQKQRIMDSFEQTLLPSLDADQYQCYWVQHTDKGRLELNFVIANVELLRGTAMTPYNHKLDKSLVSTWKDLTNLAYGLDNPNDPRNFRNYRRSDLNGSPKSKATTKKDVALVIGNIIDKGIAEQSIHNRDDVIRTIINHGYQVVDDSNPHCLKIANPDKTLYRGKPRRSIKLEGKYFQADLVAAETTPNARAEKSRNYQRRQWENSEQLQDEYNKLLTYRKDRLQKRYKRLQMDDLAYTPMDIPIQSKRASMSLFEALNMYAIARHTWPSSVYTPITQDYEDFIGRYTSDNPYNPQFHLTMDYENEALESTVIRFCKNLNRKIENEPSYFQGLFNKDIEMVIAENSQGLDNDQLDQLRQLAHIKVQNYEEASLVKRQQANNPCIENEYNGPAF